MKKKPKLKQGNIIRITWLDAFGRGTWEDWNTVEDGLKNHIVCELVGYYATEDKNFYVLSMGIQTDPNSRPFLKMEFVPKGAVIQIEKLRD